MIGANLTQRPESIAQDAGARKVLAGGLDRREEFSFIGPRRVVKDACVQVNSWQVVLFLLHLVDRTRYRRRVDSSPSDNAHRRRAAQPAPDSSYNRSLNVSIYCWSVE